MCPHCLFTVVSPGRDLEHATCQTSHYLSFKCVAAFFLKWMVIQLSFPFFFFFFVREWFATRSHEYQPCKEELVCLKIIESFLSTSANITCTHDFKGWLPEFLVS